MRPSQGKIQILTFEDLRNEYPDIKFISVEGPSGSGKSTLSTCLAKGLNGIVISLERIAVYDFIIACPMISKKITGKEFDPKKDNVVEYCFKYFLASSKNYINLIEAYQFHAEKNFCSVVQNLKNPRNALVQYAQNYETMRSSRTNIVYTTRESGSNNIVVDFSPILKEMLKHLSFKVGITAPRYKRELAYWRREGEMSTEMKKYMAQAFLTMAEVEEKFCANRENDFYFDNTEYNSQTMQHFSDKVCATIRQHGPLKVGTYGTC